MRSDEPGIGTDYQHFLVSTDLFRKKCVLIKNEGQVAGPSKMKWTDIG
jgi:hypothetical protein